MHHIKYLLPLIFLMIAGCNSQIAEKDLVGGNWQATVGYEDGKPVVDWSLKRTALSMVMSIMKTMSTNLKSGKVEYELSLLEMKKTVITILLMRSVPMKLD